jgi:hypothetical protein
VEVRDVVKGRGLQYRKTIWKYVCKVEPVRAVIEHDYFIQLIEKAEKAREQQIEKIELGYKSEGDEEPETPSVETEWDKIQTLPDSEYLLKTVLPVLYQGMTVLDL